MRKDTPKRIVVRTFEKLGFTIVKNGKHIKMSNGSQTISVPHQHYIKSTTLTQLIHHAGTTKEKFLELA